jgi:hypothetical protein
METTQTATEVEGKKPVPVAIQRLMDEVRLEREGLREPVGVYDRGHNRHNR